MADMDDDYDAEELDEQIEQMIVDNGILLHAVVKLLVQKGVLKQEEIEQEMAQFGDEDDFSDED